MNTLFTLTTAAFLITNTRVDCRMLTMMACHPVVPVISLDLSQLSTLIGHSSSEVFQVHSSCTSKPMSAVCVSASFFKAWLAIFSEPFQFYSLKDALPACVRSTRLAPVLKNLIWIHPAPSVNTLLQTSTPCIQFQVLSSHDF